MLGVLEHAGEQFAGRDAERHLAGEDRLDARLAGEPLVPGNLGAAGGAQEDGKFFLRKP